MNNVLELQVPSTETGSSARGGQKLASGTWFAGPAQAINDDRLKKRHWRVLAAFCVHADHEGYCWPSQKTISDMTGLSRTTVAKAIKELANFGYLEIVRKHDGRAGVFPEITTG